MSVFKQKNAIASAEFKKFAGIDLKAPHGESSAAFDMSNFRVLPDGSLQKRCGFATIANCPENVRGVWSGKLNDKELTFIVYGNTVARIDYKTNSLSVIGSINTTEGYANFIFFNNYLYLSDGDSYYVVAEDNVSTVEAYAPLYGKNWRVAYRGTQYEPLNLATRHIRMTYVISEALIYLCVDHIISSIDAVFLNGELFTDISKYYYDREIGCVCIIGLEPGDKVELFLTIDQSEINRAALMSCKGSVVYGDYGDSTLFLWDGNEEDVMYASSDVDNESLEDARRIYKNTVPFYIPADAAFTMTKEERQITAVCRQYDRLLIFTNQDTWMAHLSTETERPLVATAVNPSHGCTSPGAVVMCGNDPICVSDGSVLKWTSGIEKIDENNAYSISSKIEAMLPSSFFKNAVILMDKQRSEILFSDPTDEDGTLWIYNYNTDVWYKFDGIGAKFLFLCEGKLGFACNNAVYLFDENLGYDILPDGSTRKITAFFESYPTDFSVAGNRKRLCGMTLNANLSGKDIKAEYLSDGQVISSIAINSESLFPASFIKRLNSRRFCYMSLRLISDTDASQRIYSTSIWTKP